MTAPVTVTRRLDLDRLRILACLSTFCYHAIQVFDLNPYYHVKSNTLSPALDVAARLLQAVRMPLFFLIAGMVGFKALERYTDRQLIRQRSLRLLPPFVVGIVCFSPLIKYFEILDGRSIGWSGIVALSGPPPDLLVVLRRYFTQFRGFSWSHMWFPLYLFIFGILLLPVLRRLGRAKWRNRLPLAAALVLPLLMLVAVEVALRPIFPWHIPNLFWDWASVFVYLICMLSGAALIRWPELEAILQRRRAVTIGLAVGGAALYLGFDDWLSRAVGRALWLWALLSVAIGLGPWLSRGRIIGERYLSEGALPIYVLHHLPLIMIAFAVKDLEWPVWQRYVVIVLGAFAVTMAVYHTLVRPFAIVRQAFGMPQRPNASVDAGRDPSSTDLPDAVAAPVPESQRSQV
ncbi:MAG: acyltransferase family protein [Hyphomicrobiaceae bacterium]